MLESQRHLFDVPSDVVYFNSAYVGPRLFSVTDAGQAAIGATGAPWNVPASAFFDPVEELRSTVGALFGGDAEGVAFVPSVSYAMGVAVANLTVGSGRTVVLLEEQFPSNVYPWMEMIRIQGGEIITVARSEDGWTTAIVGAIDEHTAIVSVPHCHWTDGTRVDLEVVGAAARRVGAALVIDASQSFTAMPLDVAKIQPDFVASVGYKWQLGFYGLGYMWVAEQHRGGTALEEGWIVRKNADDFAGLVEYTDVYESGARRFDVGERSNFVGVAMSNAATKQISAWGIDAISESIGRATTSIANRAQELGWVTAPDSQRSPHMLGIRRPGGLPKNLSERLADANISVSVRGDSVRIAPHLHTTEEDVDRLLGAIA